MKFLFVSGFLWCASGCAGSSAPARQSFSGAANNPEPRLETKVEGERWYGLPSRCGQGPYEIDLGSLGARYGEGVELIVHTPRRIKLTAVLLLDDDELTRNTAVLGRAPANARVGVEVDNQPCIADVLDVASAVSTTTPTTTPVGPSPQTPDVSQPSPPAMTPSPGASVTLQVLDGGASRLPGLSVIGFSWPKLAVGRHIKIRFWSRIPNDFDGASFFLMQTAERPNVPEVKYDAFLRLQEEERQRRIQIAIDAEAERQRVARVDAEARAKVEASRRETIRLEAETARRVRENRPPPTAEEVERRRQVQYAEQQRLRLLQEKQREQRRQAEIKLRLDAELQVRLKFERKQRAENKRRRRKAYCNSHHKDTSCWGPGGYAVSADLDKRAGERRAYCTSHPREARCWSSSEWSKRRSYYAERLADANRPPPEPEGPPPAPLSEQIPPKLSENAQWRPGYWHWTRQWHWIAGVWRVPESDLQQELTTRAPERPPAIQVEVKPPAPIATAVWITGFWQWDGTTWIWVRGSWQLPPNPQARWRPTSWSARGSVHVLVPGGWIKIGGGR